MNNTYIDKAFAGYIIIFACKNYLFNNLNLYEIKIPRKIQIPRKTQLIILLIANFLLLLRTFAYVLGEPISEGTGIIAVGLVSAAALFSFNKLMMYFWDKY